MAATGSANRACATWLDLTTSSDDLDIRSSEGQYFAAILQVHIGKRRPNNLQEIGNVLLDG